LRYGLEKKLKGLGKFLLAYSCVGVGAFPLEEEILFQANQSFEQLQDSFSVLQGNGFWLKL